jgi:hypothetical protein
MTISGKKALNRGFHLRVKLRAVFTGVYRLKDS